MCFTTMVRETRTQYGISQKQLARSVGVTQAAFSKYETKERPIPDDIAYKVASVLKSPRLIAEYLFEKKAELFNAPLLNNVDDHLILGFEVLAEEFEEAVRAAKENAKILRNIKDDSELDANAWERVMFNEMQIVDTIPAIKLHLIKMEETFSQFSIRELESKHYMKLKSKKYCK